MVPSDAPACGSSSRPAAEDEILRMLVLFRDHYADFRIKHFHERLVKRHDWRLGYTATVLLVNAPDVGQQRTARRRLASGVRFL